MKLKRLSTSLAFRLIAFGVALLMIGAAIRLVSISRFLREDLEHVVSAQQLALAETVAQDVDDKLAARRRMLDDLANSLPPGLLAQPVPLQAWLAERHALQPPFSQGLSVINLSGRVVAAFPSVGPDVSWVDDADFLVARAGRSVVGRPGRDGAMSLLPMWTPVKGRDGQVRAVLRGTTSLASPGFLDRLQQQRIGNSGSFLLVSPRDRLFVAAGDPALVLQPTPPVGSNALHDRAMAGFRGTGLTVNAQGVEELSAIAAVPSSGWFVVARLPTEEAFSTVGRVQKLIVRSGAISVAVVVLILGSFINWMLRPLHRAANEAERMTRGEIPLKALAVVRDDEVGHLTASFNRLLAKLVGSQAELERMAHHDTLTGLPNRSLLADRMQQALARALRSGTQIAVLYLDLDGFKPINDRFGHVVGDQALQEVARRLIAVLRQSDTLARVGGDEFVLLATDLEGSGENSVRILASRCIAVLAEPLLLGQIRCTLGVSIGIALCGGRCGPERLLVAADQAMYQAKEKGRGSYVIAPRCVDPGH